MPDRRPPGRAPEPIDVSVLVPVLNERANIREVVAAMQAQRFEGTIEFLFVDGGSDDGTRAVLREAAARDDRVRVLDNPARRIPNALNIGLVHAWGEFTARMDAHTHYPPDYLSRGVERLRGGDVDWVSGPQIAVGIDEGSRKVAAALASALGTGGARFRRYNELEIEVDSGFTGIWRTSTLEAHGGWDEGFPWDEDFELAARIRQAGGRIVCIPELAASYIPRNSLSRLARQYGAYGYYRVKTSRRHPESMRRSQVLPPVLALGLVGALPGAGPVRRPARASLAAYAVLALAVSARAARTGRWTDIVALPPVFATMHIAYGVGFLTGCLRLGPPLRALARLAGLRPASRHG